MAMDRLGVRHVFLPSHVFCFLFYAGLLRKKDEEDGYEDCMRMEMNAR